MKDRSERPCSKHSTNRRWRLGSATSPCERCDRIWCIEPGSTDRSDAVESTTFTFPDAVPVIGGRPAVATTEGARWYCHGGVESYGLAVVGALLREGGTFVDVGANIGSYTIAASLTAGSAGLVHAVEPSEPTFAMLRATVELNQLTDRVRLHNCAAGATSGQRSFLEHHMDLLSSFSAGPLHSEGSFDEVVVAQRTLDSMIPDQVDMLKIDVEGAELDVLTGAEHIFERNPDMLIMFEVAPAYWRGSGVALDDLLVTIPTANRSLWLIADHAESSPFGPISRFEDVERWIVEEASPLWYANLLSVPRTLDRAMLDLSESPS